jgi:hypothetical protein
MRALILAAWNVFTRKTAEQLRQEIEGLEAELSALNRRVDSQGGQYSEYQADCARIIDMHLDSANRDLRALEDAFPDPAPIMC